MSPATRPTPPRRTFAALDRTVSVVGFGSFKIGRADPGKFPNRYEVPSAADAARLLRAAVALGIDLVDTAPAYGSSEARIGAALGGGGDVVVLTKAGEEHDGTVSTFDYSERAVESSVCRSLVRLRTGAIDGVFVHSDGRDLEILRSTPVVETLDRLRRQGLLRVVGFSGKSVDGCLAAVDDPRIDAIMVEYHPLAPAQRPAIERAGVLGKAVIVKKALAQGRISPAVSIPFILARPEVTSIVIGTLDATHLAEACRIASEVAASPA